MRFSDLTYPEAQAKIKNGAIALWPIGSTEAHGPHLPLGTDVIIAQETCTRAAVRLEAKHGLCTVVLPSLAFTITDFAEPFSGTVTIPRDTALAYIRDVAASVARQGFRAVCLVNAHLEPAHRFALRDAVTAAQARPKTCPIGLVDPADRRFASSLTAEFSSGSCHAGQYETSLVIAAKGRVVKEKQRGLPPHEIDLVDRIQNGARDLVEAGAADAYCGAPAKATLEEGERSYARLVEIVDEVVSELLKEPRL